MGGFVGGDFRLPLNPNYIIRLIEGRAVCSEIERKLGPIFQLIYFTQFKSN